jgi:hypothetical protein
MDPVRAIADAVLYEGYILWPYRRSALKNRQRWTFGGIYPRGHSEGREDDPWEMRTEVLLEGPADASVDVRVRFLQVVGRQAVHDGADGPEQVDELTVDGERHLSWEEATEREVVVDDVALDALATPLNVPLDIPADAEEEELRDRDGTRVGAVVRSWRSLEGEMTLAAERLGPTLTRLSVRVANTTPWPGGSREDALAQTLCSSHAVIHARGAELVSLTDPPPPLTEHAAACRNEGVWPVLVGEAGERHTILASPIILEDHPRIAPESPGDLFDGGEIDGLLTLSILSLTEEERAEMRDTDPRAREILERTEGLSEGELMRLHGAIRDFRAVPR